MCYGTHVSAQSSGKRNGGGAAVKRERWYGIPAAVVAALLCAQTHVGVDAKFGKHNASVSRKLVPIRKVNFVVGEPWRMGGVPLQQLAQGSYGWPRGARRPSQFLRHPFRPPTALC